jgi:DNA polymerase-4
MYAEVPHFYAAVERAAASELAARPVIVGGNPRKRGLVQSASPEALEAGVEVGMPVLEALERCPRARALRTNMPRYREASRRLQALFRRGFAHVEPLGLNAAYIDPVGRAAEPDELGAGLCELARSELLLPLRVGFAAVRFVARIAGQQHEKPGWQCVTAGEERAFLSPLPVTLLPGVGPQTQRQLEALGVRRIGELVALGGEPLESAFGDRGLEFLSLAQGRGDTRVRRVRHRQSLSQESTFERAQIDAEALSQRLLDLSRHLEEGLKVDGLLARKVSLKLRYADLGTTSRRTTLREPVGTARALHAAAAELLRRTDAGTRSVRLIGISVSELGPALRDERQLELFPKG